MISHLACTYLGGLVLQQAWTHAVVCASAVVKASAHLLFPGEKPLVGERLSTSCTYLLRTKTHPWVELDFEIMGNMAGAQLNGGVAFACGQCHAAT